MAYDDRMVFDLAKFEVINFFPKCNLFNLDIKLPIPRFAQDPAVICIINQTFKDVTIKWLSVDYDICFLFKCYIKKMLSKKQKAVAGFKLLENMI